MLNIPSALISKNIEDFATDTKVEKKYTKKLYNADIRANEEAAAKNKALLESFQKHIDDGGEFTEELSKNWNDAHDREWAIEQDRNDIERRWRQRNWTHQDYQFHELVMLNID